METTTSRIEEYLERLKSLYGDIHTWLVAEALEFEERLIEIEESEVGHYEVPMLIIRRHGDLEPFVRFEPVGVEIIGAEGQLRIVGPYDYRTITYFVDQGPVFGIEKQANGRLVENYQRPIFTGIQPPGWHWISDVRTGEVRQLNKWLLQELLREVSDYGD